MKHASRPPSGAHRWMHCAGQIEFCKDIPRKEDNEPARIGTGVHNIVERTLSSEEVFFPGDILHFEYQYKPTWVEVTPEMLENAGLYVHRVHEILSRRPGSILQTEKKIDLTHIRPGMFGHSDTTIDQFEKLVVMDYKNGFVPVHLIGNPDAALMLDYDGADIEPQLLIYGCGAAQEALWLHEEIQLEVIQPRSMEVAPIQTVTVSAEWLRHWQEDVLRPAVEATYAPDAPLTPGPWCRFCPAADPPICPALNKRNTEIMELDFREFAFDPPPPFALTKEHILKVLEWAPHIRAWLTAVHGYAFAMVQHGESYPGWKIVPGRTHRKLPEAYYQNAALAEKGFLDAGIPEYRIPEIWEPQVPSLRSPAQLEKLGKDFREAVKQIAIKPPAGLSLVPIDNRKAEVEAVTDAVEDFAAFAVDDI